MTYSCGVLEGVPRQQNRQAPNETTEGRRLQALSTRTSEDLLHPWPLLGFPAFLRLSRHATGIN